MRFGKVAESANLIDCEETDEVCKLQGPGARTLNPYHVLLSSIFRNFTCSLDHRSPVLFLRGHCTEEFCTYPN